MRALASGWLIGGVVILLAATFKESWWGAGAGAFFIVFGTLLGALAAIENAIRERR